MAVCSLKYFFVNEYLGIFISCLILLIAVVKTIDILNSSRKVSAQGKSVFITGEFSRSSTSHSGNSLVPVHFVDLIPYLVPEYLLFIHFSSNPSSYYISF